MYETTVNPKAASGLPPHPSAKYPTESSGAFELVGHEEAFPPSPLRPDEVIATCWIIHPRNPEFPGIPKGGIFEGLEMGNDGKTRWEMAGLV